MPIATPFHARTSVLCQSLRYRDWAGYYAVSAYETHHDHEYSAIRNAAALIDVSPLYKYMVTGPDATRFVDRVITRDVRKIAPGQVVYTPWCDERGKVIDDGTVSRLDEQRYRWTAADPNLRWFRQNAAGLHVTIEDVTEQVAALALQGPTSAQLLRRVAEAPIDTLAARSCRSLGCSSRSGSSPEPRRFSSWSASGRSWLERSCMSWQSRPCGPSRSARHELRRDLRLERFR